MKALIASIFKNVRTVIPALFLAVAMVSPVSAQSTGFYDHNVTDIHGNVFSLDQLSGKKIMVVNTASRCGLTPQYEALETLYQTYGGEDFVIIGFPANNFMNQEPGSDEEILEFCQENYGVSFPMMSKISVKGNDMASIYQWLTQEELNGVMDSEVSWNFQKYLIDSNGNLVEMIPPRESPLSDRIVQWITQGE